MSAITRFFFRNEVACRTNAEVIRWWERRRLPFNVAVGATGLVTLAGVQFILSLPPRPELIPIEPLVIIPVVYGVMANVAYTGGWITELWLRRWLRGGRDVGPAGPTLFRYGFVFSIGVTLLPIAMASMAKLLLVLGRLF